MVMGSNGTKVAGALTCRLGRLCLGELLLVSTSVGDGAEQIGDRCFYKRLGLVVYRQIVWQLLCDGLQRGHGSLEGGRQSLVSHSLQLGHEGRRLCEHPMCRRWRCGQQGC